MIALTPVPEGVVLGLRVQPGAKRTEIAGVRDGSLLISVTAAPDKGKANEAVQKLLAKELGIPKSRVEILSGLKSRQKKVLFHAVSLEAVSKLLAARLGLG